MAQELTQARLKELLNYDPETGVFVWKIRVNSKVAAGSVAGTLNSRGYTTITWDGKKLLAHRLAWLFVYGEWPTGKLDHINRVRIDNRVVNLREASNSENSLNQSIRSDSSSGVRGVSYDPARCKWRAHITLNRKHINLGRFEHKDDALRARKSAEARCGVSEFCNGGVNDIEKRQPSS